MSAFVLGRSDGYDYLEFLFWCDVEHERDAWLIENPPTRYSSVVVLALNDDGKVVEDWIHWIPEPYRGVTVRVRGSFTHTGDPAWAHRVPIDCARPTWPNRLNEPFDEEASYRVVWNDCCGTDHQHNIGDYFTCHCGSEQILEGEPSAIGERWLAP